MTTKNQLSTEKKEISAFQQEQINTHRWLIQQLIPSETNIVAVFFKEPELMFSYDNITIDTFHENCWKVYYTIINDVYVKENKKTLDEYTISFYLEKHLKLKQAYDEYGGYSTLENISKYIEVNNLDGFIKENDKIKVIIKLNAKGFPVKNYMNKLMDMSIDDMYNFYDATFNDIFSHSNIDFDLKSYDISYGIDDLYNELKNGSMIGLPYQGMNYLTSNTNGCTVGDLTLVGGITNVGKSSFVRNVHMISLLKHKERVVIFINEEDIKKWQRELIVFIANNVLDGRLNKFTLRNGNWNEEQDLLIRKSMKVIKDLKDKKYITIIPFKTYKTSLLIKMIKKYSSLGVKYFILDTFKQSADSPNQQAWQAMKQEMVQIYDTIKPIARNVHMLCTFQLAKSSARQRYFTIDNIGESKSIADVASVCIMLRNVLDDEKFGGKRELSVYRVNDDNVEEQVRLSPDKHYQIAFIVKTREGSTSRQVVFEHDLGRNIVKEIGYTIVPFEN